MKKYITPAMDIRIFNNTVKTEVTLVSDPDNATNGYVAAFGTIAPNNKAKVQMESMKEITKFTF